MFINEQDIINDIISPYKSNNSNLKIVPFDSIEYINRHKVDLSIQFEEAESFLDVVANNNISCIATLENFTLVLGKPKSGKTFFISLLAASFLKKGVFMETLRTEEKNNRPKVILFDTEQSKNKVQQIGDRIYRLSELENKANLIVHSLRALTTKERLEYIEGVLYNTTDVSYVIIDGIKDLVSDINCQSEATEIASKLLKWTAELNIHLVTILHQNKADSNARGHLGSELVHKAETVLSLTVCSGEISYTLVEPVYCREKPFTPFAFQIDDNDMPFFMTNFIPNQKGDKKTKLVPQNYNEEFHKDCVLHIFADNRRYKYQETYNEIQTYYKMKGVQFGQNKAKDFLVYLNQKLNLITTSTEGNSTYYYSNIV
jgi:hypothetical protein